MTTEPNDVPPAETLGGMILGFEATQLIYVAAKLGIADHLSDGPKTSDELARSVGAHPRSVYRLLRALTTLDIFAEAGDGRFELTPLAEPLRTDGPDSMRTWAIMWGEEWTWRAWGDLLHNVTTGENAFGRAFGMGLFEYLQRNPGAADTFNRAMTHGTRGTLEALSKGYDLSGTTRLVDVAGGHGLLIVSLLRENPDLCGVLFDLPSLIEGARGLIEAEGVADRCELVAGDFFESVPEGADAYLLKWIIHDWDDDRAVAILKNCRRAMRDGGRVLVVERIVRSETDAGPTRRADITMMVLPGGQERTEPEFRALLEAAGLRLSNVVETDSDLSVIEGVPA